MALIKNEEQRELALLNKVEKDIERREKRERIHHLLIAGLAILTVAAFVAGHATGHYCKHRR